MYFVLFYPVDCSTESPKAFVVLVYTTLTICQVIIWALVRNKITLSRRCHYTDRWGHVVEDVGTNFELNNDTTIYIPTFDYYQNTSENIVNIV